VLRRYETALLVTEAEPLVAYIRSFKELMGRPEQAFVGLRAHIENELSRNGHIRITNDTGMFYRARIKAAAANQRSSAPHSGSGARSTIAKATSSPARTLSATP
jgi:hypothetical protein